MSEVQKAPTLSELRARLAGLMPQDQHRLRRRIDGAKKSRHAQAIAEAIRADVERAEQRVAARRAATPQVSYPEQLPVSQRKDDILAAIRDHQVVIVAGETGSGKTTQLPKICLELGRGVTGQIGHTQPRRIAARTVAERVAEELGSELGQTVGFKVRFSDQSSDRTMVKVMTDGILLAEMQQDRLLRQYDTLIIDEAHERSLNIDFILGYLKQLLPRRPDLKVVITSATIDPERFSRHFGDAPIVEVSGRTYPVEVRYRPIESADEGEDEVDQFDAICNAVLELQAEGSGDVLVFLSGEREIRDTADALARLDLPNTEILPLFARLSFAEQHRVFQSHTGRRIVLATNVAETSLTVPGIKYVIDPGTARISRYSHRLKVQRLPIEPVSQASANQRKGRCGRTSDGICIRLYSEEDFLGRPEFTDPEILRTNLASVILQMISLGLGDLGAFPFIDPPDRRNVTAGVQLLEELGALEGAQKLTPLGRRLSQLPVDPRLARMVLEAERNGCVREVMVITAALSIQDPRERPADKQAQAQQLHARFADKDSDFVGYLNLWNYLQEKQQELSSNQFRKLCRAEFLNYLRVREWQDIYSQLRSVLRTMDVTPNEEPAAPLQIHVSLLSGLLSHVGLKDVDKHEYLGARGARFAVFPGSALFRKTPRWVMAAELVETTRLWARVCARIEPEWIEPLAQHLVKRNYSEPHWEKKAAAVMAMEKVTLYGVPIVAQRKVNYGRIDPALSRELFIRHALVEGDWETTHAFFAENRRLLDEVEELENRARRRDILVDDETLFDFYDKRIAEEVVSGRHFDSWWKKTRREQPDLLTFDPAMLVNQGADAVRQEQYPDRWSSYSLTYQFEPGTEADGVTVHIGLPLLGRVDDAQFSWQVPGLREELVTALIKSLPKALRRNFVPAPDTARDALAGMPPGEGHLLDALERELRRLTGVTVPREAWDLSRIPDHLKMTYRIVDDAGKPLAESKSLDELRSRLAPKVEETVAEAAVDVTRAGITSWSFGELPRTLHRTVAGHTLTVYPALVDEGTSVAVKAFDLPARQALEMWAGTRRLLLLTLPPAARFVQGRLSNEAKLSLSRNPHRNAVDLLDDCAACAVDQLMTDAGGPAWDEKGFTALRDKVRADVVDLTLEVVDSVRKILAAAYDVEQRLARTKNPLLLPALADMRQQLSRLVYRGFVTDTGWQRLPDLERYLRGIERRLEKVPTDPARDRDRMLTVHEVQREYDQLVSSMTMTPQLREIRWMIEELRVGLFAQALGTAYPVSDVRIYRAMDALPA
ncbi:ATP-dependent RNA helicase HrpA [Dactylosporangium sp. AC04546]|uniref:ATP-dependent RNA helicase HrpA n=1 Tax=Dactylosporangium sp. AC04546 TaxID=2862460 RepID=UPI001EE065B2|nr:ATP-dependent RNA helicase HrpA [Dactylosporangium sp. AC04546]WVK85521.1 ATP-dependent RNA helicase HrpA [Dactylosporangium sp. AC04546]